MKRNRGIVAVLTIIVVLAATAKASEFDQRARQMRNLPKEWFACKENNDCVIVDLHCGAGIAVNGAFKHPMTDAMCQPPTSCGGWVACAQTTEPPVARCEAGECSTVYLPPGSPWWERWE